MATMNVTFVSEEIAAAADEVWRICALDFDTIAEWASGLSESIVDDDLEALPGALVGGRICEVPRSGQPFEELTSFDADARKFSFSAKPAKAPGFLGAFEMHWHVEQRSRTTTVVSGNATAQLNGIVGALMLPLMRFNVRRTMSDLMTDLQVFAETGGLSPKKQKANRKLATSS